MREKGSTNFSDFSVKCKFLLFFFGDVQVRFVCARFCTHTNRILLTSISTYLQNRSKSGVCQKLENLLNLGFIPIGRVFLGKVTSPGQK